MTETDTGREAVEKEARDIERYDSLNNRKRVSRLLRTLLARAKKAEAERDEARRRRDEWRKKAEGYDDVRRALREKVGDPWPPHMSRILWAGIAADEKKRADEAEAERDTAWNDAIEAAAATAKLHNLGRCYEMSQRQINAIMALRKGDPT